MINKVYVKSKTFWLFFLYILDIQKHGILNDATRGGQDPQDRTSPVKPVGFLLYGSDINGSRVQKDKNSLKGVMVVGFRC
jgi:hypothetical protein